MCSPGAPTSTTINGGTNHHLCKNHSPINCAFHKQAITFPNKTRSQQLQSLTTATGLTVGGTGAAACVFGGAAIIPMILLRA